MRHPVVPPFTWLLGALSIGAPALMLGACTSASAQGHGAQTSPPPAARILHQEHAPSQEWEGATLQVSGQAQVSVPADRVKISFAVETEATSAQQAVRENAQRMESVIASLRSAGVEGLEIETFGYNLFPDYRYPSRGDLATREIAGYRAQNNIRVTVPAVESAGEILDAATEAGANRVQSLQFEASDLREARLQALAEAVRMARQEAETIAGAMGAELGPAITVQGGAASPGPRVYAAAFAEDAARAMTPVEPAGQTVSATVTITYRILEPNR